MDRARIPEPRSLMQELVMRGLHENLDRESAVVRLQLVTLHLANLEIAIKDRRAPIDVAQTIGVEGEARARRLVLEHGRLVETGHVMHGFPGSWIDADIRAGN